MLNKRAIQFLIIAGLAFSLITPGIAADSPIQVENDEVVLNLPEGIIFNVSVKSDAEINRVTLLFGTSERTCHEKLSKQDIPLDPAREQTLSWQMEFIKSGLLPPGVELWWQWEIRDTAGNTLQTEKKTLTVEDQRHNWRTRTNENLTINWYEGDDAFGSQLLAIAANGMRHLENDMGIQFNEPIRLTIYPTASELQEALIYTQDWVGGVAYTNFNAILLNISESDLGWARDSIPHELSHLVVEARIHNCQGITIPTWLNEGLAIFAEGQASSIDKQAVMQALLSNQLPTLNSLSGSFSAYSEEANLAYAQSGMVVEYLIAEYGAEKMDDLLTAIQAGALTEDAFREVYGFNTSELDSAWRQSLGFEPLSSSHTTPEVAATRTQIPTLALWTAPVKPGNTPIIQSMVASLTPSATTNSTPAAISTPLPISPADNGGLLNNLVGIGFGIGVTILILGLVFLFVRRRRA